MLLSLGPDELRGVVSFCSAGDLARAEASCTQLARAIDERVWEAAFQHEFLSAGFVRQSGTGAKEACRECHALATLPNRHVQPVWKALQGGAAPEERQGAALAPLADGQGALLFGGWTLSGVDTELWHFDAQREPPTWTLLGAIPGLQPTYGHVLTTLPSENAGENTFLVTGGLLFGGYVGASNRATLLVLSELGGDKKPSLKMSSLRPVFDREETAESSNRRAYHSATAVFAPSGYSATRVVLFGGFNEEGPITELEIFDHGSGTSVSLGGANAGETGARPEPRFGHSCTVLRDTADEATLLVLGGSSAMNNMKYGGQVADLHSGYILSLRRNRAAGSPEEFSARWEALDSTQMPPRTFVQRCHGAVRIGRSGILLFGGGRPQHTTNEAGVLQVPRSVTAGESAAEAGPFSFKRVDVLPEVADLEPAKRQNHGMALLQNNKVLIFGGCLAGPFQEELGDTWLLQLSTI